jgi:hypothetical protein
LDLVIIKIFFNFGVIDGEPFLVQILIGKNHVDERNDSHEDDQVAAASLENLDNASSDRVAKDAHFQDIVH